MLLVKLYLKYMVFEIICNSTELWMNPVGLKLQTERHIHINKSPETSNTTQFYQFEMILSNVIQK